MCRKSKTSIIRNRKCKASKIEFQTGKSHNTENATFLNYEIDGVEIGLIAVKGEDGTIKVVFNTCQSCNPSPNAYFIQKGEYLECQNCKTKFSVEQLGLIQGGCNPLIVKERKEENGFIIISSEYVSTYIDRFRNWNGPKLFS